MRANGSVDRRMGPPAWRGHVAAVLRAAVLLAAVLPMAGLLVVGLLTLAGCERKSEIATAFPVDLTRESVCAVDGMLLMGHPGPKGQALTKDGTVRFYCDLKELFQQLHDPAWEHRIVKAYVQPFDGREWGTYADGWAEVNDLVYVLGSRESGAMGPTLVPFRTLQAAGAFVNANGGRVVPAEGLTAATVAQYLREVREQMRAGGAMPGAAGMGGAEGHRMTEPRH